MNILLLTLGPLSIVLAGLSAWLIYDRVRLIQRVFEAESGRDELLRRADEREASLERLEELEVETARLTERLESKEREFRSQLESLERQRRDQIERDEQRVREINAQYQEKLEALTSKALAASNEQFLKLAEETFAKHRNQANTELDEKRKAFSEMIAPISQSLAKTDERLGQFDKARTEAQASLREHLEVLATQTHDLSAQTSRLVQSLRSPQVRGRWGEMALRNVVELAGMSEHCDFATQETVTDDEDARFRPDMTIRLPGQRLVVVDAKAPLQAYLEAIEADSEERRAERMKAHARQVRLRIDELAGKRYQRQFDHALDFTVLFVPGDQFLSAALHEDPSLLEYAAARHVVLTTPATMIALLKAVSFGWTQASLADDAAEILKLGKQLHERVAVMTEHLARMGAALSQTVKAYNKTVGSYESRVLTSARRLEDHHVRTTKELTGVEPVMVEPRVSPAMRDSGTTDFDHAVASSGDEHTPMLLGESDDDDTEETSSPRKKARRKKRSTTSAS